MGDVTDSIGRTFQFDRIRFKMDESLLQQAAQEVRDESRQRGQLVFDRYCRLHLLKYRRNYEPSHFANGRIDPAFQRYYDNPSPVISINIEITDGVLFDQYVGMPVEEIERAVRRDPRAWVNAGSVVAVER